MRNCATLLTSLTYYFVFLVIVLEMADVETLKAYCGLAGLGLTQAVPLQPMEPLHWPSLIRRWQQERPPSHGSLLNGYSRKSPQPLGPPPVQWQDWLPLPLLQGL